MGSIRAADVRALASVQIASWWAAYARILPKSYLNSLLNRDIEQEWKAILKRTDHRTLGLWVNDQLIGFIHIGPPRDSDCPNRTHGEIHTFYLLERYWGKGLGRLLFDQALREFKIRRKSTCVLWALAKNKRANQFYERQGFSWDGQLRRERVGDVAPLQVRYTLQIPLIGKPERV